MSAPADGCQSYRRFISLNKVGTFCFATWIHKLFPVCSVALKTEKKKSTFSICNLPSPLLGRGHALEVRWPIPPTLSMQHSVPNGRKEEGGQRCAVLLALRALWRIPLSGTNPGHRRSLSARVEVHPSPVMLNIWASVACPTSFLLLLFSGCYLWWPVKMWQWSASLSV